MIFTIFKYMEHHRHKKEKNDNLTMGTSNDILLIENVMKRTI